MAATPSQNDFLARQNRDPTSNCIQNAHSSHDMARSAGTPQRLRNEESWVEISSQPSSSSLSSIGDEIVTTGLRIQHDPNPRRRRRTHPNRLLSNINAQGRHTGTSSQEEYDESESEEDRVMTSSNEHIVQSAGVSAPARQEYDASLESDGDDDDENATALGTVAHEPAFTPQPNAFSHPPSSYNSQRRSSGSYFPRNSQPLPYSRPSHSSRTTSRTQQRTSAHQADHDAALRASLTTLLSCAAAARGLPKQSHGTLGGNNTMTSIDPIGLRLVPESELAGTVATSSRPLSPSTRAQSSPSISSQDAAKKEKRKAIAAKPGTQPRATKKKKVGLVEEALISPTLLAWVVSAGVVVLVSVVGFGAGYVIGREVGQREALAGLNGSTIVDSNSCRGEVSRVSGSLRRFKWGTGVARSVVA